VRERSARPAGWELHASDLELTLPLDLVTELDGEPPLELHMVFARDGAYVPAVVRKPAGDGPFPAVMCMHGGSGGLGFALLADWMRNRSALFDRLVAEGYVVCFTEGRMELEDVYGTEFPGVLDHQDVVEVFRYLQRLPEIDPARIGTFGVSHGGELQMKLISEMGEGPAALVPTEPAVIDFLGLHHEGGSKDDPDWTSEDSSGFRIEEKMQFRGDVADDQIEFDIAWERIQRISDSAAFLVVGRDDDHLQGVFRKLYELLERAGKNVEWATWDHPEHAYQFGTQRTNGTYERDPIFDATVGRIVEFLNRHVRDRQEVGAARA
jgi:acetyl esterase/lipase